MRGGKRKWKMKSENQINCDSNDNWLSIFWGGGFLKKKKKSDSCVRMDAHSGVTNIIVSPIVTQIYKLT